jgi:ADP-ribose pyrophosphatase YjhB (NUDIX family)
MRTRMKTGTPMPKALACGMLEDEGRVLFLVRTDEHGTERLEMPCVLVPSGRSPFAEIKTEFQRQTGIDAQVHEIVLESRYNAGTRKRKMWVPCLVFKVTARERRAKPSGEFSGFRWLSLEEAKKQRLGRNAEWLPRARAPEQPTATTRA